MPSKNLPTHRLLPAWEAAAYLMCAPRTIQHWGQQWERNARRLGDPYLPSSPRNGLRRYWCKSKTSVYDPRDINEYVENSARERIQQPINSWRRGEEKNHD